MHFDPNDRQSLTARVYEHIREDIIEGRYANGAYLVETKLAEELDVSRTPIREALKQLELEDLVVSIPNRGVMVQGMSSHDIDDIFTVRYLLEGQAAYWAAERIDAVNLARLTEIVLTSLHRNTRQVRVNSLSTPDRPTHSLSEHRAIFEAIERKDAAAAKDAMESHVRNARKRRSAEGEAPDAQ